MPLLQTPLQLSEVTTKNSHTLKSIPKAVEAPPTTSQPDDDFSVSQGEEEQAQ